MSFVQTGSTLMQSLCLDNGSLDGETEAMACGLRREERIENLLQNVLRHSRPTAVDSIQVLKTTDKKTGASGNRVGRKMGPFGVDGTRRG